MRPAGLSPARAGAGLLSRGWRRSCGRAQGSLTKRSGCAAFWRRISSISLGGGGEPSRPPSSRSAPLKSCHSMRSKRDHQGAVTITTNQRTRSEFKSIVGARGPLVGGRHERIVSEARAWAVSPRSMTPMIVRASLIVCFWVLSGSARAARELGSATEVRGMTISCQSWGGEWGSDGFPRELDDLAELGVNWVAIHPYVRIHADGHVSARAFDPEAPPDWLARPIREAHARGLSILVIPHVAYWGSPWEWRGAIELPDPESRARFFETYSNWIVDVARATRGADGFSIGNELDRLVVYEARWRDIVTRVRAVTSARLTYASNWTDYARVPFWDALDAVGVQAYFPLSQSDDPSEAELAAAWRPVIASLSAFHRATGKPIVFTELGYNLSLEAARSPWVDADAGPAERARAEALQERCLRVALAQIAREHDWLRGAFLWKWFVGEARRENFLMKTPAMRSVIGSAWRAR